MAIQPDPPVAQRARELLALSENCAQSSFAALAEHLGFDAGSTLKALTPFPGGIALRGETCGAVTGSLMAIGMVLGRDRLDDRPGAQPSIQAARHFCRAFEEEFGGTPCRVILERALGGTFDFTRPEGGAAYMEAGGPALCSRLVGRSVLLAVEAIEHVAESR
jgi:C_GCAxxG_C_C family probable redox protein